MYTVNLSTDNLFSKMSFPFTPNGNNVEILQTTKCHLKLLNGPLCGLFLYCSLRGSRMSYMLFTKCWNIWLYNQVAILAYTNSIVSTTPADIIRPRSKMTQNKYKNKCMEQIREVKYYMSSYNNLHQGVWGIKTEVLYTLRYY